MLWKSARKIKFIHLSLVSKLTLLYVISTISILSVISIFIYPSYAKIIHQTKEAPSIYLVTECNEKIVFALLLSTFIAIIFGYIVAKKGLNKLEEFENKIEKINIDSIHERLDIHEWPSEIKNLGKKFNFMLDRLQSVFVQLSQFSSDITHELRTPLNNLKIMTEIALADCSQNEKNINILEKYMIEYDHLSKLIENLLFFARSDNGQISLKRELINVRAEILKICEYYQPITDEHFIQVSCFGTGTAFADLILFKRVISNLILNALKYTNNHGKVEIIIKNNGQNSEICIKDDGIGIPAEHLPRIFDRFYRVDSSRALQSGGLGLGLSIVKSIIDLHNGQLKIESKLNAGTSVFFTLATKI